MTSATGLCGVIDQGAGWAAEFVVEHDGGGQGGEPGAQAGAEVGQGAGAVTLERENVFEGPEDRFDPLADRREVRLVRLAAAAAGLGGDLRRRPECRGARRRG